MICSVIYIKQLVSPLCPLVALVLWYCGALVMWCCAHFNEMTAKLMRNAKNPVSRLQFGLKVHFSLYLLRARYVLRCHNGSHLQV